jgi:hypothetical protein
LNTPGAIALVNFVNQNGEVEMLRSILIFCAMFMAVGTANAEPLKLTNTQMDMVTAGDLGLPNHGKVIFEGFDNAAPVDGHPNFFRSDRAFTATTGHGPSVGGAGNEGPWSAGVMSPAIECIGCF